MRPEVNQCLEWMKKKFGFNYIPEAPKIINWVFEYLEENTKEKSYEIIDKQIVIQDKNKDEITDNFNKTGNSLNNKNNKKHTNYNYIEDKNRIWYYKSFNHSNFLKPGDAIVYKNTISGYSDNRSKKFMIIGKIENSDFSAIGFIGEPLLEAGNINTNQYFGLMPKYEYFSFATDDEICEFFANISKNKNIVDMYLSMQMQMIHNNYQLYQKMLKYDKYISLPVSK